MPAYPKGGLPTPRSISHSHLQELLDPTQIMLVQNIGFLQEAAVLLVNFTQEIVEYQCGVGQLLGSICPEQKM